MSDLISKQAAITLPVMPKEHREYQTQNLDDAYEQAWFDLQKCIEKLPSVQPEIIRCRNCKFASGDSRICMKFGHSPIGELDFCAWAERRTDEADYRKE